MKKNKYFLTFLYLLLLVNFGSCGSDVRDRENYEPETVQLSSERHVGGYGRDECLQCHNVYYNVHRRPGNGINAEGLNELIRQNGGSRYCKTCHGNNGTTP